MMRPRPSTVPIATRMAGVMRLFSNEYFTRKTMPRKRTKPPIQAKSFTPRNASQSIGFAGGGGGAGGRRGGGTGGGGGGGGGFSAAGVGATAGFGANDGGGGGGGAARDKDGEEITPGSGWAGATEGGPVRDSSAPTRATRWRTADLSLCTSTRAMIRRTTGVRNTSSPRQTTAFSISASQSGGTIDEFPGQIESVRQMSGQRL